ncbi:hypothetical protein ACFGVR_19240 [Mucilaginibacter sp. AW1-3]
MTRIERHANIGIPMNTYVIPMCFIGVKFAKSAFGLNFEGFGGKVEKNTEEYLCFHSLSA